MHKSLGRVGTVGKRDAEIVTGWDRYYKIAIKNATRYLSFYFPTREDLLQASALAATVARFGLGEEARMDEVTRILRRTLKQQATAYGMRQRMVRLPGGKKTMQTYRPEVPFALYEDVEAAAEEEQAEKVEWLETRMMIVGVGEWTRRQASQFTDHR